MQPFTINQPTQISFGPDALNQICAALKLIDVATALLVYGGNSLKQTGNYDKIVKVLHEAGIETVDFGGNTVPTPERLHDAADLAVKEEVQVVFGIGGSLCMDMSKAVAYGAKHPDFLEKMYGGQEVSNSEDRLLVVTVPTYPSGGSETDANSESEDPANKKRGTLVGVYPDYAVLDPEYTMTIGITQTAIASLTTFMQASVDYLGQPEPISDGLLRGILTAIPASLRVLQRDDTNYEARASLMWAGTMATSGYASAGKGGDWKWSIYDQMDIILDALGLPYRNTMLIFFKSWLLRNYDDHADEVNPYCQDILGIDTDHLKPADVKAMISTKLNALYHEFGLEPELHISEVERQEMAEKIEKRIALAEEEDPENKFSQADIDMYLDVLGR